MSAFLLERNRRSPNVAALNHEDLPPQQLLHDLLQRSHVAQLPERVRLHKKRSFVLARDRCCDQRPDVPSQLEGALDRSALPDVEHSKTLWSPNLGRTHIGTSGPRQIRALPTPP